MMKLAGFHTFSLPMDTTWTLRKRIPEIPLRTVICVLLFLLSSSAQLESDGCATKEARPLPRADLLCQD